ncbi:PKD domain-containing protein [Massilia consociata]|uniref:PKD domain-containing protein n=1 Tax=Massilia consociata TaxID=760117 RepID=A0ABV6FJF5_9BURK
MRRIDGNDVPGRRLGWWLPCLLSGVAIVGAASAQVQAPGAVEDGKTGSAPTTTTYRVINLGSGALSSLPEMNDRGQVAFSLFTPETGERGYFYNGTSVQDIGSFGGGTHAVDVNNAGQVVGWSATPLGVDRAFIWSAGSGIRTLGGPAATAYSVATAINNAGVVIGIYSGSPLAFRWSASEGLETLSARTPGAPGMSSATALNDAGLIAGIGRVGDPPIGDHLFAWTRATGAVDIDTLGSVYALPAAVSERGEIVGSFLATRENPRYRAFLWSRTTGMLDLGTGRGVEAGLGAINDKGLAAGIINYADGTQRGSYWTRGTGLRDIGTFGGRFSRTHDVNNLGQIVGSADNRAGQDRAFVWTARTGLVDLNTRLRRAPAGLVLDDAVEISDNGAIVATSNAGLVLLQPGHGHKGGHAVGPVTAPGLVKVGAPLHASVAFVDEDRTGTRSATWSWGDGSGAQAGRVRESNGTGSASASHSFSAPGIYTVGVTLVDRAGRSTTVRRTVVVYEPSAGVVAGTGAFISPQGALAKAPQRSGKATFSLLAPPSSARAAAGAAQLHVDLPGLNLRSVAVKPLGLQGGRRHFEGSARVNGVDGYQFRLATGTGAPAAGGSTISLKVWHTDPVSKKEVVDYHNGRAQPNAAGSQIVEGSVSEE